MSLAMVEAVHSRLELANEQLDVALELFLSKRSFVASLTLAGAAEEIFGKALTHKGKKTTLEYEHTVIAPVEEFLRQKPLTWKVFAKEKNRVRNAAKHMGEKTELDLVADLEDEALWMVVRACDNYQRLDLPSTDRMNEFNEWFLKTVVGVDTGDA